MGRRLRAVILSVVAAWMTAQLWVNGMIWKLTWCAAANGWKCLGDWNSAGEGPAELWLVTLVTIANLAIIFLWALVMGMEIRAAYEEKGEA